MVSSLRLILFVLFRGLANNGPPALAVLILLVLDRQLAKVADDVLHLGIVHAAVLAAEVVEVWDLVEQEVGDGHDDDNTYRVSPDNDRSYNIGVAVRGLLVPPLRQWVWQRLLMDRTRKPAEDTE